MEDLTRRKDAEHHYRVLLNTLTEPAAVFLAPDGAIADYNTAFVKMSGYAPEELEGMSFVDFLHPDEVASVMGKFKERMGGGNPPSIYETRVVDRQGNVLSFELSIARYEADKKKGVLVVASNLTPRRKVETALRESEERYKTIVQSSVSGILGIDSRGKIFEWNSALEHITGLSRVEAMGKDVLDVVSLLVSDAPCTRKTYEILKGELAKVMGGGTSQYDGVPVELEIVSLDGKKRCIELKPSAVGEGEGLLMIGIVVDTTEKRRLLDDLKEREHTFRAIAESSPATILLSDEKGNNIYVSPSIEKLTGFAPEELIGTVRWFVHPEDTERMKKLFKRAYEHAEPGRHVEFRLVKKDGRCIWASASWEPMLVDGKLLNMVLMIEDITRKKQAELEASRTLRELSTLHEISKRTMDTSLDPTDILKAALGLCMELLELDMGAVYVKKNNHLELVEMGNGMSEEFSAHVHTLDLQSYPLRDDLYAGRASIMDDYPSIFGPDAIREKEGITSLAVVPIYYHGTLHGVMYLGRTHGSIEFDTAFLCALGELLGSVMHVSTLYTSLKESYEELKRFDELKANFLDVVNHELRTPLTTIYGYLSLLCGCERYGTDETIRRYADGMERGMDRLMSLVRHITHVKKIEEMEDVLHTQDVDVHPFIDDILTHHREQAAKKAMTIELSGEHAVWNVDTEKLSIMFEELITNALRYGQSSITVAISSDAGHLCVDVWNDGEPIPEHMLENVFDKFFIAHDVDRHSQGMGLGLFIVKHIVSLHGGRIWVESSEAGTTFHVVLPALTTF